jgi:uncharacterized membrane protein (DUF373 family)
MLEKMESKLRSYSSQHLHMLEALLYTCIGYLLAIAALAGVIQAAIGLWTAAANGSIATSGFMALDQVLLVLILIEILHTVRISLRSQELVVEPFLIVGLMASIRRILVITMQAAKLTEQGHDTSSETLVFRNSMIELGVLGALIVMFVGSIWLLRRKHTAVEIVGGEDLSQGS